MPEGSSGEETVYRRIQPLHVVGDPKAPAGYRASSAAFDDDDDGSSMSVYLQSIVFGLKLTEESVVYGKTSKWAVAAIPVETLIKEDQAIRPDPVGGSTTPHPCDPAHALVDGEKKPKARRNRISAASPLVYVVP
jgi:hypothetical protein